MKAPRYILQVCGLTCEPQTAKGHSTLDSRVLPAPGVSAGYCDCRCCPAMTSLTWPSTRRNED
jgi:hypothetical protein